MEVYNPPNAEPVVLERIPGRDLVRAWQQAVVGAGGAHSSQPPLGPKGEVDLGFLHTKSFYRLAQPSMSILRGCTTDM